MPGFLITVSPMTCSMSKSVTTLRHSQLPWCLNLLHTGETKSPGQGTRGDQFLTFLVARESSCTHDRPMVCTVYAPSAVFC